MVSDSELIDRLREFLRTSDLNTTTTAIVRRKLEEEFQVDLSDRKAFIRTQVDLFLQAQIEKPVEEEEEEAEGDEEEPKLKSQANDDFSEFESAEQEEDDSGDEVSSNGKGKKKRGSSSKNKDVKKRGAGGGFAKVSNLSPELQKVVGVPEMARTEVVKKLWAYIKENNLQDPDNKKNIRCDESLRSLFRVDTINMFQMNKALSKHIWPLDQDHAVPVVSTPRVRKRKKDKHEDADDAQPKEKRHSGFLAPLRISEAMVKFIGTGETILPRSAVVKRIWDYIKVNNLQDPSDKKTVICDDKLKELFEVDSFVGFTVPKLLKTHFIKEMKEEQ
ncbi:hypothetical protein AQUCO_01000299v1 [Aquilegia coerulea]|uniref:DM2 domain-containing protein n=1 Tax=Aquilegia coerulea TaxID=218851 RepID=A0A2G5E995_AQUCA|nr:hypothetical protein AQUCO_01000299v1 [Aquilegia coerulea]